MKYCPYCGTQATVGASFCMECGKSLKEVCPRVEETSAEAKKASRRFKPKKQVADISPEESAEEELKTEPQPGDGYDGYYDDVRPLDEGEEREKIDTELIKKIAVLIVGVGVIVSACVVLICVQA